MSRVQSSNRNYLHKSRIDRHALNIVDKLQKSGFTTYLVGGCVRDLLAGVTPKDYDIGTSALPQQVRKKVPGSYIIGRRFQLVLVKRADHQFEVATFRKDQTQILPEAENTDPNLSVSDDKVTDGGTPETPVTVEAPDHLELRKLGDNFFGTPEEDAKRRDFTVNGLFYDPFTDQLLDYVGGVKDVENRIMRMIGDPTKRIIEDPVRSLRAVRLSHKLHFTIDPELKLAIKNNSEELLKCAAPRRREEWLKMLKLHNPITAFLELYDLDLMKYVLPTWQKYLDNMDFSYLFFDHWRSFLALTQDPEFHDLDALQEETPRESFHYYLPFYWAAHKTFQEMKIKLDFNEYENLFKVEMGLFKSEMAILEQILELSKQLDRVDSFKKRGPRRQRAFVLQPTFEEALKICYLEQNLSPLDLQYWLGWLQQSLTDPAY